MHSFRHTVESGCPPRATRLDPDSNTEDLQRRVQDVWQLFFVFDIKQEPSGGHGCWLEVEDSTSKPRVRSGSYH